jgi:hypothetical protein
MCHARGRCVIAFAGLVASLGVGVGSASAQTFIQPTPYLSFNDSPFKGQVFSHFQLEDFEDGVNSLTGVSLNKGWIVPNVSLMDSVDGDDGQINGLSEGGKSFYSNFATNELVLTFDAMAPGGLPTHAGVVWTDVGFVGGSQICKGEVRLEAWGAAGNYLGSTTPVILGDGLFTGQTPEDRFLGVTSNAGLSKVRLYMPESKDFEIDHIQFGTAALPAPGSLALFTLAGLVAGRRRR